MGLDYSKGPSDSGLHDFWSGLHDPDLEAFSMFPGPSELTFWGSCWLLVWFGFDTPFMVRWRSQELDAC